MDVVIKRAYEQPTTDDGYRILVDRLWPRALTKEKAHIDLWLKEIGPSTELRKWFAHEAAKWSEFKQRYRAELADKQEFLAQIKTMAKKTKVTLVYAAKDHQHNN